MLVPNTTPTGNTTIRLADIPLDQRLTALTEALRHTTTEQEAIKLLHLALEPGDAGGRIAA
jgi:hypothetical protein